MCTRIAAALIAFLLSFGLTFAHADEVQQLVAEQQAALEKLTSEVVVARLALLLAFTSHNCGTSPARIEYDNSIAAMLSFRNQNVPIANRPNGNPIDTFKTRQARSAIEFVDKVTSFVQISLADEALQYGCYEAANGFYRQIMNYTGPAFDPLIRRAQIGIEDVREKLRKSEPK